MAKTHINEKVPTANIQDGVLILNVQAELYPLDVVFSAAYVFMDRAYVFVDGDPRKNVIVTFEPKEARTDEELRAMCGNFINELMAVRVRNTISDRNKSIREYIVSGVLGGSVPEDIHDFESLDLEGDLGLPSEQPKTEEQVKTS